MTPHPDDNAATWRRQRVVQDEITNGAWAHLNLNIGIAVRFISPG